MSRLADITGAEVKALRADGIEPTLEEIVWLNDLGRLVENTDLRLARAAGKPVRLGDAWLWPLTIQAGEWYVDHACRLFEAPDFLAWALGFALALGRDEYLPGYCAPREWRSAGSGSLQFAHLVDYRLCRHAVNAWALRRPFRLAELREAILAVLPDVDVPHLIPQPKRQEDAERLDILAELAAGSGQPAEYWRRQVTGDALAALVAMYRQRAAAFGGSDQPKVDEALKRAFWEFHAAVDEIRKAHRQEAVNGAK